MQEPSTHGTQNISGPQQWPVFPCNPLDKRPLTPNGFKDATKNPDQIKSWRTQWPNAMRGVPMGAASGVFCVDQDRKKEADGSVAKDGVATWAEWENEHGKVNTRIHETPSTGRHALFTYVEGIRSIPLHKLGPGIEIKGEGGYIVVPPSHMADGRSYTIINDVEPISAPGWLLKKIEDYATRKEKPKGAQTANKGSQSGSEPPNIELIKAALSVISSDEYDDWYRMAGALHQGLGSAGFKLFEEWSSRSAKYDRNACEQKWAEASKITDFTLATIFFEADKADPMWRGHYQKEHEGLWLEDFYAYMPQHKYIFIPTRELWPPASIDGRLQHMKVGTKESGKPFKIKPSMWLDRNRPVDQMTWAPGEPLIIKDRLLVEGGWINQKGKKSFNTYVPPSIVPGVAEEAGPWLDHVRKLFGDDAEHIIRWLAQRVQCPQEKINHALILGGQIQGTGKDTLLAPVRFAVGPWNFADVTPLQIMGSFTGFLKSVILRVNEARDLGESNRYKFYDHSKQFNVSPPEVLRINEKNTKEYYILNRVGLILTTNYKTDGIYLPADDRRHFVAWTERTLDAFPEGYFFKLWKWYFNGGFAHVTACLKELDIAAFDPKAPPPKTQAYWDIISANRPPEDFDMLDVLDGMHNPVVVTLDLVQRNAKSKFLKWLEDPANKKYIPRCFERCGYSKVTSESKDKMWKFPDGRQVVYCLNEVSHQEKVAAIRELIAAEREGNARKTAFMG
jgi:hypothetical protein